MKIVWNRTGDYLDINQYNQNLSEYWLNAVNSDNKNAFTLVQTNLFDDRVLTELQQNVQEVNNFLRKLNVDLLLSSDSDWLDQTNLNTLHAQWVKVQHKHKIIDLMSRMSSSELLNKFHKINKLIHQLEFPCRVSYSNDTLKTWQVENIFGPGVSRFGTWHIELHYQNLGRSTYDKWYVSDRNLIDVDTNDFTHIGGLVHFRLCNPHEHSPPFEYANYCKLNNFVPYGNKLPLGNFVNADLTKLRRVFKKNVGIENNRISFEV